MNGSPLPTGSSRSKPTGSFPDRTGGQFPGVYEEDVADQFEPVVPPQANGLKTDTRWAALTHGGSAAKAGLAPWPSARR